MPTPIIAHVGVPVSHLLVSVGRAELADRLNVVNGGEMKYKTLAMIKISTASCCHGNAHK